jgi:hypothetical protein
MPVYYIYMSVLLLHLLLNVVHHGVGHVLAHVHLYPNKDRSVVMLTSSIRLCYFSHFEAPEWFLVRWQIALYSYMSSHLAL